jgi:hypothetical protein
VIIRPIIAIAISLTVLHSAARAETESYPKITGELSVEVENDWTYDSDDRANQNNDLYTTLDPSVTVQLSPSWSIFAHAVLEPLRNPEQFENRAFEDHGLYLEGLYLAYENGPFGAKAGKLNVGFGVAWDITPGVFGTDFAEDGYETSERIGGIAGWTPQYSANRPCAAAAIPASKMAASATRKISVPSSSHSTVESCRAWATSPITPPTCIRAAAKAIQRMRIHSRWRCTPASLWRMRSRLRRWSSSSINKTPAALQAMTGIS